MKKIFHLTLIQDFILDNKIFDFIQDKNESFREGCISKIN